MEKITRLDTGTNTIDTLSMMSKIDELVDWANEHTEEHKKSQGGKDV